MQLILLLCLFLSFTVSAQTNSNILVVMGDSMSAPLEYGRNTWPYDIGEQSDIWSKGSLRNYCLPGNTTSQIVDQYPLTAHTVKPASASTPGYFFLYTGDMDVFLNVSAATIYSNLKTLWKLARQDGYKVVAFAVMRVGSFTYYNGQMQLLTQLNDLILSDPSLYDYLVRADLVLPDPIDQTYFSDGTHPNEVGMQVFARAVANALGQYRPYVLRPSVPGNDSYANLDLILNPQGHGVVIGNATNTLWHAGNLHFGPNANDMARGDHTHTTLAGYPLAGVDGKMFSRIPFINWDSYLDIGPTIRFHESDDGNVINSTLSSQNGNLTANGNPLWHAGNLTFGSGHVDMARGDHNHDASVITSGTLDRARIPMLPYLPSSGKAADSALLNGAAERVVRSPNSLVKRDVNGSIECNFVRAKAGGFTSGTIISIPAKTSAFDDRYYDATPQQLRAFLGLNPSLAHVDAVNSDAAQPVGGAGTPAKLAKFSASGEISDSAMTEYTEDPKDYGDASFATNGVHVAGSLLVTGGLALNSYVQPGASYRAVDGSKGLTATNYLYGCNADNTRMVTNTIVIKDGLIVSWTTAP